ncbi:right-handed parallel beta-helix repeat-containing protein, partial [archaeon]|nr:right-handed parallel beta-helix repeat-containing protein [archaeon]
MHKKRINNRDYFYTTIRESKTKTKTIYLGPNLKKAKQKEKELTKKNKKFTFLKIFTCLTILFALIIIDFSYTGFAIENFSGINEQRTMELNFSIDIEELNIISEDNISKVKMNDTEIIEINETEEINQTIPENITNPLNDTMEVNETRNIEINFTQINLTEISPTNITENITELYYEVIINEAVKWEKNITLDKEVENLQVKLPKKAENITIKKLLKGIELKDKKVESSNNKIQIAQGKKEQIVKIIGPLDEVRINYYMPGPTTTEKQETEWKKEILVSSEEHYENILTYTYLNNTPEESINLYHSTEKGRKEVNFVSYDKDENGLVDYIEWITPHLSNQTFELEINILNIQSYPAIGGNWTVKFNTTGQADLIVTGVNDTLFGEDIEFLEIKCGETILDYETRNNSITVYNYSCDKTGVEISEVITQGKHNLEFNFGGQTAYAHNLATFSACGTLSTANEYYKLTQNITNDDGTCITIGATNITIDCQGYMIDGDADSSGYGVIINNANYDNLTIKNCTIQEFARNLYVGANSDDITIENSHLLNGYWDGMLTYSVQNMRIENSTFSGVNEYGAYITHSSTIPNNNWTIINSNFTGGTTASDQGIVIYYLDNSTIQNSRFDGGTFTGTYGYGGQIQYANNIIIENSHFEGHSTDRDRGLYLMYSDNVTIFNSTFISNQNDYASLEAYTVTNSNITNNTFYSPLTYGLTINQYSQNNVFENNNVTSRNGIYVVTYSNNNNLTNNIIDSSTAYGIYITNYATGNRFIGNNITGQSYSIYATSYASDNDYINNTIHSNTAYGIYLNDHAGDNLFYNNNITTSGTYGIRAYLSSGENNFTSNNISSPNNALRLESDCNNNYIDSNYISSSANLGVYIVTGSTENNFLINNIIKGGTTAFQDSSVNTNLRLTNNTFTATNGWGAVIVSGTNVTLINNTIKSGTSNDHGLGLSDVTTGLVENNIINGTAHGIYLYTGTNHVNLTNNVVWGDLGSAANYYALYMTQESSNNRFENNSLSGLAEDGIYIDDSPNNVFIRNNITAGSNAGWTTDAGIYMTYSSYNNFTNNIINNTGGPGIYLAYSNNNTITDTTFENNYIGIYLAYGDMRQTDFANNKIMGTSTVYDYRILSSVAVPTKLYFLNCSYDPDAEYWNTYSSREQLWYGVVNVSNTNGQVNNSRVLVYDNASTLVANETTGEDGLTDPIPLREYTGVYLGSTTTTKTYYNNHTFQATESEHFSGSGEANMSTSKTIYITLEDWPLITILNNYPIVQGYKATNVLQIRANETRRNDLITAANVSITFANGTTATYSMTNGTDGDAHLWEYNYTINTYDVGGAFNITAQAVNDTGYNYINDTDSGFSIDPQIIWLRTYDPENKSKSFFAQNESSKLKAYVYNSYENYPKILIIDSSGTTVIDQPQMTSEDGTIFYYNYTLNGSVGFYNATIFSNSTNYESFDFSFYQGNNWITNFTDNNSNMFVYSKEVNVSEPNLMERYFLPVDVRINFTENTDVNSIRVTSYNGSIYTEIPSQVYNYTATNNTTTVANVVWLTSLSKSENRTYHIHYNDIFIENATYNTDLSTYTTTSNYRFFNNSFYTIRTDSDNGAVMDAAWTKQGSTDNLAGQDPMQTSPYLLTINGGSYSGQNEQSPTRTLEYSGPIFNKYVVSGYLSETSGAQNTNLPFNQTYWTYSKNNYIIYESDLNISSTYNLEYLIDYFVFYGDSYFNKVAFGYSNGSVSENTLTTGNGADYASLDISMIWLGAYHNTSKTAIGEIFLNRSSALESGAKIDFWDQPSSEFYKRYLISSVESVTAGSRYTTKLARIFWDGEEGYTPLNDTYYSIHNEFNYSIGSIEYGDTSYPTYSDYNVTPSTPNDNQSVTCYSSWTDDLRLKQGFVETNATGTPVNHSVTFSTSSGDLNYTIPSSDLRGTSIYCKFILKDIGNNFNSTPQKVFTVTDVSPPNITTISISPSDPDDLDPGVLINVTANVTDKISLNTTILHYKGPTDLTWNETTMTNYSGTMYTANFTTAASGNYTYRINATDAAGNNQISNSTIVLVEQDLTWAISPTTFEATSGLIGSTIEIFNLTINNTADYTANFTLTSNRDDSDDWSIYYNGSAGPYEIQLGAGNTTKINITAGLPTESNVYSLVITATHDNSTADPPTNISLGDIVAYANGPYIYDSFTVKSESVLLGATNVNYTIKVKNLGNETATGVNNTIHLPNGWTTSDELVVSFGTISPTSPNNYEFHTILVNVPSNAAIGGQVIIAEPITNNTNQTQNASLTVTVIDPTVTAGNTGGDTTGGGSGGGGGGKSLSEEESSRFFNSS